MQAGRNIYEVIDKAKVADILIVIMSCSNCDHQSLKKDPDSYAGAIDDRGYNTLSMLRAQGIPPVIGVLQHLEQIPHKKQATVKRMFNRYFESEFESKCKFHSLGSPQTPGYETDYKLF